MGVMAFQITSLAIVYSTVYSGADKKKTSKLRVTGLCAGNSPVTGEFPAQRVINAEIFPFDDVIMETLCMTSGHHGCAVVRDIGLSMGVLSRIGDNPLVCYCIWQRIINWCVIVHYIDLAIRYTAVK